MTFYEAREGAKQFLFVQSTVLISVSRRERPAVLEVAREFDKLKFKFITTEGTGKFLHENGIDSEPINKLQEGRPNIIDKIMNKEIHLVINTPAGKTSEYDDSYIRKTAIKYGIPYITTLSAALAAAKGIAERKKETSTIRSLQEYHKDIG